MKEIKYKIWNPNTKKMTEWDDFGCSVDSKEFRLADLFASLQKKGLIFREFTGLLDKNGKEIYEGDIVKRMGEIWDVRFSYDRYILGRGNFEIDDNNSSDDPVSVGWKDWCEIIGNIYENPDLLK